MIVRSYLTERAATEVVIDGVSHTLDSLVASPLPNIEIRAIDQGYVIICPATVAISGSVVMVSELEVISQTEARQARIASIGAAVSSLAAVTGA